MTSAEKMLNQYISHLVGSLPGDLKDLAEDLSETVCYADVESWGIKSPKEGWSFLKDTGLPKSCPTMIELTPDTQDIGESVKIGYNNYGDLVCIEKESGAVVYYEHDGDNKRHCINKSAFSFLVSICAWGKQSAREVIREEDPHAVSEGQWWDLETSK